MKRRKKKSLEASVLLLSAWLGLGDGTESKVGEIGSLEMLPSTREI